ncbi:MAG: alpha-L-rhamnosidase C-terminal domain-containing protein [Candidatus Pseudobacter hemicellulosilyticus]|uniref:Alpha-L-rhamnosidase C-terminal domain-containing protein n=1 Tax=Candidatus Pseudobacter hemicellulosilyticus TaxID=3121375 RepID=A0AAJ5WR13_9BACT|nr:MAG: alpha-L-rhamnosidase C-terminal domain-containing protein [Pseudobacter sp.]
MRSIFTSLILLQALFAFLPVKANEPPARQKLYCNSGLPGNWTASWIVPPGEEGRAYGVYYFRKSIELAAKPQRFIVHVSADNRYKLLVNGQLVSLGPARGDTYHWNYETVDLAPFLSAGKNIVAAQVWNEGEQRPEAQISVRTAFIIQGASTTEELLNTNNTWKCIRDEAYQPLTGFFAASTGELINQFKTVKGWMLADCDDSHWPLAAVLFGGQPKGLSDGLGWMLQPSPIPPMQLSYQRIPVCRKAEGIIVAATFPSQQTAITIPANTTATLLLDQTFLTNAYLTLLFSKGKNAGIAIRYAEAMYTEFTIYGPRKGHRDEVEGRIFSGRKDSLLSDGSNGQSFTNLNFRTYRYIQLLVRTENEPLIIEDIYGTFTGYPFQQPSELVTDNAEMKKILDIGWRTARLNAWETYTDCPYYEQLQYIGDTRVQAVITYYNSADNRLPRHAIELMDQSRLTDGVTFSRYPTRSTQIISPFSLWYIGMLHDYWMYRGEDPFIAGKLPGARAILQFFSQYQEADGSLKDTPYWTFVDWAGGPGWFVGAPPKGADGASAILDLQLLWAYQWAAELETTLGIAYYASLYREKAAALKQTIQHKYWNAAKGLYADTRSQDNFSQHANALAMLTGMLSKTNAAAVGKKLLADSTLTQCSIYFKYYLHQALVKAGLGNDYMNWLDIWRKNMEMGLTTWTEDSNVEFTRSDCHAWGSSPNIEFFRTVLGIDSEAPGFSKVRIEPHLGTMTSIGGTMPHPNGKIGVSYALRQGKWQISVSLPSGTSGKLVWKGKEYMLKAGENKLVL